MIRSVTRYINGSRISLFRHTMPINFIDVWPGPASNEALTREREREREREEKHETALPGSIRPSSTRPGSRSCCKIARHEAVAGDRGRRRRAAYCSHLAAAARPVAWRKVWRVPPWRARDVVARASGLRSIGQRCGLTRTPSSSRMHLLIDSWTPVQKKEENNFAAGQMKWKKENVRSATSHLQHQSAIPGNS